MKSNYVTFYVFILLGILLIPSYSLAAQNTNDFIPLVGIPFIQNGHVSTIGDYVNAFYYAAISVAAMLAVMKIIIAGVKYITTDIAPTKGQAKKDIRGAIIGLLIVVGAVLILRTINPNLTVVKLNAPNPSVGLQQGGPPPVIGEVNQLCQSKTGCKILSCPFWRASLTCRSWCSNYPGSIFIDNLTARNFILGKSVTDQCAIPNQSIASSSTQQTQQVANQNNINTQFTTKNFDQAIYRRALELNPNLQKKKIYGFVQIPQQQNNTYVTGTNGKPIADLNNYKNTVLTPECKKQGGTQVLGAQYGSAYTTSGMIYYCVK